MLELLFPERGCLRFSTSNNSLKSSFLHNCILGGKKDATLLHVYKWKLECHIFKYGIHLDLMTKSRNFLLHYKEKCSPLKESQFLGSLRVFQKEIWLTLRAIWYSLLPSSVDFFLYQSISLPNCTYIRTTTWKAIFYKVMTFKIYILGNS